MINAEVVRREHRFTHEFFLTRKSGYAAFAASDLARASLGYKYLSKTPLMGPLLRHQGSFRQFGVLRLGAAFAASDLARASLGLQISLQNTTNGVLAVAAGHFSAICCIVGDSLSLKTAAKRPKTSVNAPLVVFGKDFCDPSEARVEPLAAKAAPSRSTPNCRKVTFSVSEGRISGI